MIVKVGDYLVRYQTNKETSIEITIANNYANAKSICKNKYSCTIMRMLFDSSDKFSKLN